MYMLSMENVIQPSVFLTQGGWVGLIRYHMYDCSLEGSFLKACVELFALICCMICIFEIILYLIKYLYLARYLYPIIHCCGYFCSGTFSLHLHKSKYVFKFGLIA